jgi:enamine deaminase RidA (YjgF/YER057c/UK114 family)
MPDNGENAMSKIEKRLAELGITLPTPTPPIATFVGYLRVGDLLYISGQVSTDSAGGVKGVVGVDVNLETAQRAARICGINILAQAKTASGDLDRVTRVVRLGGFIQAGPDFYDIPKVINGCSDLMVEVFGKAGEHVRAAVGVYRLPLNFAVEVDAIFELAHS